MIRRIIQIDESKCDGCGLCARACHEGAIGIVDGKARLLRDDYCDGLGDCLPACPAGAISFVERQAAPYDEAAVRRAKEQAAPQPVASALQNFPVQIKLVPENAPWFHRADLLIAADCTAYAYGSFHRDMMAGKATIIACPKLDAVDYSQKLARIFANNDIRSITVARMSVPCCGGLVFAVEKALQEAEKNIPLQVVTIAPDGTIFQ